MSLFYVGFYSPSEPGRLQIWRPKIKSPENVPEDEALNRFKKLAKKMRKGKRVDKLEVASVALFDEHGTALRCQTADGTEAEARPYDAGAFLQTAPRARAMA